MKLERTLNIEHSTSNIEPMRLRALSGSMFDVRCSMFDVRLNARRRGFSFAEVMFAVVILGIGFIMVAAVFPVAIRQTQSTGEENTATNAARTAAAAVANMRLIANNITYYASATPTELAMYPAEGVQYTPVFPPTVKNYVLADPSSPPPVTPPQVAVPPPAVVVPFTGLRWSQLQSNIVSSTDPRYSYVAFYKRENNSSVAELIVVAVAARNRAAYDSTATSSSDIYGTTTTNINANITRSDLSQRPINLMPAYTAIVPDKLTLIPGIQVAAQASNITSPEGGTVTPVINSFTEPTSSAWYANPKPLSRYYTLGRCLSPAGIYPTATVTDFEINPGDSLYLSANSSGLWGQNGMVPDPPLLPSDSLNYTQPATLQPTVAYVQSLKATTNNPSGQITLSVNAAVGSIFSPASATQGAFVIIADDCPYDFTGADTNGTTQNYSIPTNTSTYQVGKLNGRIFRLGAPIVQDSNGNPLSPGTFLLDPAYGMQPGGAFSPDSFPNLDMPFPSPGSGTYRTNSSTPQVTARCYIIGAGKDGTGNTTGQAQDLGAFATYIQVQ